MQIPNVKINVDLEDCDKVLRVEGEGISAEAIVVLLMKYDIEVEVIE
jgi:hypothetical protein